MDIGIYKGQENLKKSSNTNTKSYKTSDINNIMREGKILFAQVLAKQGENVLLKINEALFKIKLQGNFSLQNNMKLKVDSLSSDKILLSNITKIENNSSKIPQTLKFDFSFKVTPEGSKYFSEMNIKDGETILAEIVNSGNNESSIKICNKLIGFKTCILLMESGKANLKFFQNEKENSQLILYEDNKSFINDSKIISNEQVKIKKNDCELVFKNENQKILSELISNEKIKNAANIHEIILQDEPQNTEKNNLSEITKIFKKIFFEIDPKTLENIKSVIEKDDSINNQDIITFSRMTYNSKLDLIEAYLNNNKLFIKPELEFQDQLQLFLRFSQENGEFFFTIDFDKTKENQKLLQSLSFKFGDVFSSDQKNLAIINKLIENNLPVTRENLKIIKSFINSSSIDFKTSVDLLTNPNLLIGLFYHLNKVNDHFLLKGIKKRRELEQREQDYKFSIFYESENLGDILVELLWSEKMLIYFFCGEENTVKKINKTVGELKERLNIANIIINVEHNKAKVAKEPVKLENINLSNFDIMA